jgi:hypothetical protein
MSHSDRYNDRYTFNLYNVEVSDVWWPYEALKPRPEALTVQHRVQNILTEVQQTTRQELKRRGQQKL